MPEPTTYPSSLPAVRPAPESIKAGPRVGLFGFEGFSLPTEIEMSPLDLEERLRVLLGEAGHPVASPPLLLRDMVVVHGCTKLDAGCMSLIASDLGADRVIVGKLETEGASNVRARVRVYWADGSMVEIDRVVPATVEGLEAGLDAVAREVVRVAGTGSPPDSPESKATAIPESITAVEDKIEIPIPPPAVPKRGRKALRWAGVGTLAAGVLAGSAAAWMSARWFSARRDYREAVADWRRPDGKLEFPLDGPVPEGVPLCRIGPEPIEDAKAAELARRGVFEACRRGRTVAIAGWSLAGVSAALIGAGAVMLLAGGKGSRPASGHAFVPWIGPDSVGVTLRAEF